VTDRLTQELLYQKGFTPAYFKLSSWFVVVFAVKDPTTGQEKYATCLTISIVKDRDNNYSG
jgi:hypothetical protein